METSSKHSQDCLALFTDPAEATERLAYAARATARLARYRETVNKLERCHGSAKHLGQRAREAENDTRVILKCALDSLNELRDSRAIEAMGVAASKLTDDSGRLDIGKAIAGARKALKDKLPDLDLAFLDEAERTLEQFGLEVRPGKEEVRGKMRVPEGKEHSFAFSPKVRPGDAGRVGSAEFFSPTGPLITFTDPAFADDDCHHRPQSVTLRGPLHIDSYANLVGAFAHARDTMARHTKVAEHFGRPHLKANPVWVIVAIAIVAAVLIIAGATLEIGCAAGAWTGSACDWGWGLLIAGAAIGLGLACVASAGGCTILINGVVVGVIGG